MGLSTSPIWTRREGEFTVEGIVFGQNYAWGWRVEIEMIHGFYCLFLLHRAVLSRVVMTKHAEQ